MIELIKQMDVQDATICVCMLCVIFIIGFRIILGKSCGEFVENIEELNEPKIYRLKALTWFHKGEPPTINQSAFHSPQIPVEPCMLLKTLGYIDGYIIFEVKANECKGKKLNGQKVYYKKELFSHLEKIEIG